MFDIVDILYISQSPSRETVPLKAIILTKSGFLLFLCWQMFFILFQEAQLCIGLASMEDLIQQVDDVN
jgi:hypothetical protein